MCTQLNSCRDGRPSPFLEQRVEAGLRLFEEVLLPQHTMLQSDVPMPHNSHREQYSVSKNSSLMLMCFGQRDYAGQGRKSAVQRRAPR